MTREEAIKQLEDLRLHCRTMIQDEYEDDIWVQDVEALDIALSALRPVSREQVEKMKKEPVEGEYDELYAPTYKCPECGFENIGMGNFWRNCGCPHTDEAVEMVKERMEKLYETI